MITLANEYTRSFVRTIWKDVFGDSDEYLNLFFSEKYKDENTLLAIEEGRVVASLQMLPYEITFYNEKITFYYLAGLATLPAYRNRGLMAQLIKKSHELMRERQIPLSILIPAEESLFAYYERFGYAQAFQKSTNSFSLTLKEIWEKSENQEAAYTLFDKHYNQGNFCVQKSFLDFKTILREEMYEGFPEKHNLWGVARIIDAEFMLNLYAKAFPNNCFVLKIQDKLFGDKCISIENGSAKMIPKTDLFDFSVNENLLARLLFGFETKELNEPFRSLFPQQNSVMNYMLE